MRTIIEPCKGTLKKLEKKRLKLPNANRSDHKIYSAPDDGHGSVGDARECFASKRINKNKKWKPK